MKQRGDGGGGEEGRTCTLSLSHKHTVVEDVLLFQNYLFQKESSPFSVAEGQQAVYTVKLDGPPLNDVAITVNPADNFIRCAVTRY